MFFFKQVLLKFGYQLPSSLRQCKTKTGFKLARPFKSYTEIVYLKFPMVLLLFITFYYFFIFCIFYYSLLALLLDSSTFHL